MTDIQRAALSHPLIAAHRGASGGNIPCNSLPAFEAALKQGADVIELDVSCSNDGVLYVFHPGMEPVFLGIEPLLSDLDHNQIDRMFLLNQDRTATVYPIPLLEDALKVLKGRCFINIDKFWNCPTETAALIRKLGMQDQVIIKTRALPEQFARVEEIASDLPYMVIVRDADAVSQHLCKRPLRFIGVEALFASDDAPVAQEAYLQSMHERSLVTWVNAIIYDHNVKLCGGYTDDVSVSQDPALGWGWLIDRGFNLIQTDWPLMLRQYLNGRK